MTRQQKIIQFVKENSGCTMIAAIRGTRTNPNEGDGYGYNAINRCIAYGKIIRKDGDDARSYKLFPVKETAE